MDYLTILTSCYITLFTSPPSHRSPFSSPCSSPTSSSMLSSILPPKPISVPVSSILYSDNETAWFLMRHILAPPLPNPFSPLANTGSGSAGRGDNKRMEEEAEVMVWREIDRAKMCIRAIGGWFGANGGRIGLKELAMLGEKFGVEVVVKESGSIQRDRGQTITAHSHSHGIRDDTTVMV
ncbi:hypothetical protein B9479_000806 [Cryptococcus floricola]|uniref:Uncharacterized protein n=1 Tax=Cryptococcus floricola TaxID=2591691 RepID=A0A5D3B8B2_9TREE|nr:hypothetical protein B9479_000806 [Cryptococcus floricola]